MVDLTDDTLARQCLELRNIIRGWFEEAKAEVAAWDLPAVAPKEARRG